MMQKQSIGFVYECLSKYFSNILSHIEFDMNSIEKNVRNCHWLELGWAFWNRIYILKISLVTYVSSKYVLKMLKVFHFQHYQKIVKNYLLIVIVHHFHINIMILFKCKILFFIWVIEIKILLRTLKLFGSKKKLLK